MAQIVLLSTALQQLYKMRFCSVVPWVRTLTLFTYPRISVRTEAQLWLAGLEELQSLDVLDVHHNRISNSAPLSHLTSLRILNISSNCLACLSDLSPLRALAELNVRRNALTSLHFTDDCASVDQPLSEDCANDDGADSEDSQGDAGSCHTADNAQSNDQNGGTSQSKQISEGVLSTCFCDSISECCIPRATMDMIRNIRSASFLPKKERIYMALC